MEKQASNIATFSITAKNRSKKNAQQPAKGLFTNFIYRNFSIIVYFALNLQNYINRRKLN